MVLAEMRGLTPAGLGFEDIPRGANTVIRAYEVGVLCGAVRPGQVIAVVRAGPIRVPAITGSLI